MLFGLMHFQSPVRAAVLLPDGLSQNDRKEALRILGFGMSSKILSDPYPLGGYAGFEVAVSFENLPAEDIGHLGSGLPAPQQEVTYPKLTIGKGLYNDVDLFFQATPYRQRDEISQYGAIVRWGFHQAGFLPISSSLLLHFNSNNISNRISTRTYGADMVSGINVDNVSLYAGVGALTSEGTFLGGASDTTESSLLETERVSGPHTLVGANLHFQPFFVTVQIDRYTLTVFSAKAGVRF